MIGVTFLTMFSLLVLYLTQIIQEVLIYRKRDAERY